MSVSIQFLSGDVIHVRTMPTLAEFRQRVASELQRSEDSIQLFDSDHLPLSRAPLPDDLCYIYLHDADARLTFDSEQREFLFYVRDKLAAIYTETESEFFLSPRDLKDYYWVETRISRGGDIRLLDFEVNSDVISILKRDMQDGQLAEEFVNCVLNIPAKVNVIQK